LLSKKGELNVDSWQDLEVNPLYLNIEKLNQVKKDNYNTLVQDDVINLNTKEEQQLYINNISKYVLGTDYSSNSNDKTNQNNQYPNTNFSKNLLNNILYQALFLRQKVILGDMSELLLRRIVCNTVKLKDVSIYIL